MLRRQLQQLTAILQARQPQHRTRIAVDTAPLLERDFAQLAGIGWRGKNTMLISREIGSWFFLGCILTTAELAYDTPFDGDYCGTCTRCLTACPTDAFPEPYVLDSNRCISYLTIERRDSSIPESLRSGLGDWIFGCDVCQEVCPWNRFAPEDSLEPFEAREDLRNLSLPELLKLDETQFQTRFADTPLQRTGRDAIVRNAAIVAGNRRDSGVLPILRHLEVHDASEFVREAARWAIQQISEA